MLANWQAGPAAGLLHRGDGVGVSCECQSGKTICHHVRTRAQVRLNPVRKPEGLGGDAEGVRAELVRPRESMVERYTHCDVPDEQHGEYGRACCRGRTL